MSFTSDLCCRALSQNQVINISTNSCYRVPHGHYFTSYFCRLNKLLTSVASSVVQKHQKKLKLISNSASLQNP